MKINKKNSPKGENFKASYAIFATGTIGSSVLFILALVLKDNFERLIMTGQRVLIIFTIAAFFFDFSKVVLKRLKEK